MCVRVHYVLCCFQDGEQCSLILPTNNPLTVILNTLKEEEEEDKTKGRKEKRKKEKNTCRETLRFLCHCRQ